MKNRKIKELMLGGIFIAIGLVLPIFFHQFGLLGPIFLPMHIPVLIAGCVVSPGLALLIGLITPFLSSVFTGMPPFFPIMPIMIIELGAYGLFTSIFYRKFRINIYLSLIISMIIGRILAGFSVYILVVLFGVKMNALLFVKGAIIKGIPGIIIQLILIPLCIYLLKKKNLIER